MKEMYSKVEVVTPRTKDEKRGQVIANILHIPILVLVTWWFFASWFPELGLTYWQLILPVFVFRGLVAQSGGAFTRPRFITKD